MLWSAVTLYFFGFLHSGEILVLSDSNYDESSHLRFSDILINSLQKLQVLNVRIKALKTDPFRVGIDIFVGKTGNIICPVSALLQYTMHQSSAPGPFFRFVNGHPLTRRLVANTQEVLTKTKMDGSSYSGHSFRSSTATTAAK